MRLRLCVVANRDINQRVSRSLAAFHPGWAGELRYSGCLCRLSLASVYAANVACGCGCCWRTSPAAALGPLRGLPAQQPSRRAATASPLRAPVHANRHCGVLASLPLAVLMDEAPAASGLLSWGRLPPDPCTEIHANDSAWPTQLVVSRCYRVTQEGRHVTLGTLVAKEL